MKLPTVQRLYTRPHVAKTKIKGRKTGAVKTPLDRIGTPLDKIQASSPYPRP